jgi:hypothetical protein
MCVCVRVCEYLHAPLVVREHLFVDHKVLSSEVRLEDFLVGGDHDE